MRNEHEPPSAAWNIVPHIGAPEDDDSGCFQLGCKTLRRKRKDYASHVGPTDVASTTDQMWDVIPFGYDTQGNEVSFTVFLKSNYAQDCSDRAEELETEIRRGNEYPTLQASRDAGVSEKTATQWLREYLAWYRSRAPETEQRPADQKDDPGFISYDEHIAGPNCVAEKHAYSGYQISYEEMKACTTIQCLGPKSSESMTLGNWKPLPDDEEFERTTEYCLSGLGDRPGDVEVCCYPARHDVGDLVPGECGGFMDGDLAFHPYCFEVYKRASLFHKGRIDIDFLAEWFDQGARGNPPHPAVSSAIDQWWRHNHGDEFLVANPINVPVLRDIIERATNTGPDFNTSNCAFDIDVAIPKRERDDFGRLPEELRAMILQPLGSKDIANLRQASSSFRRLPISLWHRLIQEEMPWLWEAWCDRPYSFWVCTTMRDLETHYKAVKARLVQKQAIAQELRESRKPTPAQRLDRQRTDWHWLYREIKREWKNMKGLQNRERIWYAQAHIIEGSTESKAALKKLHADYTAKREKVRDD